MLFCSTDLALKVIVLKNHLKISNGPRAAKLGKWDCKLIQGDISLEEIQASNCSLETDKKYDRGSIFNEE